MRKNRVYGQNADGFILSFLVLYLVLICGHIQCCSGFIHDSVLRGSTYVGLEGSNGMLIIEPGGWLDLK